MKSKLLHAFGVAAALAIPLSGIGLLDVSPAGASTAGVKVKVVLAGTTLTCTGKTTYTLPCISSGTATTPTVKGLGTLTVTMTGVSTTVLVTQHVTANKLSAIVHTKTNKIYCTILFTKAIKLTGTKTLHLHTSGSTQNVTVSPKTIGDDCNLIALYINGKTAKLTVKATAAAGPSYRFVAKFTKMRVTCYGTVALTQICRVKTTSPLPATAKFTSGLFSLTKTAPKFNSLWIKVHGTGWSCTITFKTGVKLTKTPTHATTFKVTNYTVSTTKVTYTPTSTTKCTTIKTNLKTVSMVVVYP